MNLTEILSTQRKGKCLIEAQEKFQELVQRCIDTGKKGKFTLVLTVAAADSTVVLNDKITTNNPEPDKIGTTFYADDDGSLHREDPRQPEFKAVAEAENAVNE